MKRIEDQTGLLGLNKDWKFREVTPEPREAAGHNEVYQSTKAGAAPGPGGPDFDDGDWETVCLPNDYVTGKPFDRTADYDAGYKKRGQGWYRKRFLLPEADRDCQILLLFEGMSNEALVYVNGQLLYRNHSGYTGFTVDMTDVANFGDTPNVAAVFINAAGREGWWYEGAGIYRPVWIVRKPPVHIAQDGCFARPVKEGDGWRLAVDTELENTGRGARAGKLTVSLAAPDGTPAGAAGAEFTLPGGGAEKLTLSIPVADPILWSPETPVLYRVTARVESGGRTDGVCFHTGFRTAEFDPDRGFLLNGAAYKILGFCNHQDHAGVGVAVPYAIKEYRVKKMKALGANAWRCAHNPDPDIPELCDRLGLLVMDENRIFNAADWNLTALEDMVRRDRNHPSVICWSLFNEEPLQGTEKGRRLAQRMKDAVRAQDGTRPVTGAMNGGYFEPGGAVSVLDVVGINYNPAAYDEFHRRFPDKPLLASETCSALSVRGEYRDDPAAHRIASFDCAPASWGTTVRAGWQAVAERPFVAGTFVWTGMDYRGEPSPYTWPSAASFFGTYDSCGFEKDACYLYKAFWGGEPLVHLVCNWEDGGGETRQVSVFGNCPEVELSVNGSVLLRQAADPYEQLTVTLPYTAGTIRAVGYRDGKAVAADEKYTSGPIRDIRVTLSRDRLFAGGLDAVAVNVALLDGAGHVVTNRDREIRFAVTGGAVIAGVGNGDPNCHEPDVSDRRTTFHGLCQAILRNTGTEAVTLRVSAGEIGETLAIPVLPSSPVPEAEPARERYLSGFRLYYRCFDAMPDPALRVDEADMNRFEPVAFEGRPQAALGGQYGKFALYRAETRLNGETRLEIPDVRGRVWAFAGDRLLGCREAIYGPFRADLPADLAGRCQLNLVLQNLDPEWQEAGICSAVKLSY